MIFPYARHRIVSGDLDWRSLANLSAFILQRSTPYSQPSDSEISLGASGYWSELPSRTVEPDVANSRSIFKVSGPIVFESITCTSGETWTLVIGQRSLTANSSNPNIYPILSQQFVMPADLTNESFVLAFPNNEAMYL